MEADGEIAVGEFFSHVDDEEELNGIVRGTSEGVKQGLSEDGWVAEESP